MMVDAETHDARLTFLGSFLRHIDSNHDNTDRIRSLQNTDMNKRLSSATSHAPPLLYQFTLPRVSSVL
ncbi:hypothetical protein VTJ04DRAFT_5261 [Mycothermus thermophilus]|uniref:uncharacterized protein n=1 Tax=Humicola insolens TaxID=85995 RepID=UPI0037425039